MVYNNGVSSERHIHTVFNVESQVFTPSACPVRGSNPDRRHANHYTTARLCVTQLQWVDPFMRDINKIEL